MACAACGAAGTCGCASVTIPIGPKGDTGATGAAGAAGPTGPAGIQGPAGAAGATPAKYANTFTVTSTGTTTAADNVITITKAAITSCNVLINTCASTPIDADFVISIWQVSGSQYREVTNNTTYVSSIIYDTTGNTLTISFSTAGTFRVCIFG